MIQFYKTNPSIIAGTSTRKGGVSKPPFDQLNLSLASDDQIENVIVNRKLLAKEVGVPLEKWIFPALKHTDHFIAVDTFYAGEGTLKKSLLLDGVDALYTKKNNLVLALLHADCVPIMLMDNRLGLIGIIHAGWQGTIKQLTKKLVTHWINYENASPKDIQAIIGPAISINHYPVGLEVVEMCKTYSSQLLPFIHTKDNQTYFDLIASNSYWLESCGILKANIMVSNQCTYANPDLFFSYRYQKVTGRQCSFIVKKASE